MIENLLWSLTGAGVAAGLSLFPALHIYNIAGIVLLLTTSGRLTLPAEALAFLFLGMITSYAIINTIPSIFLSAPDESTVFVVLPGQSYALQRRGYEAVLLTGIGGLGGLAALVALAPVASRLLPVVRAILQPHLTWILWLIIAYMLLSEWPKGTDRASAGWHRWWDGWRSLIAGLTTFLLSGLLGFVLMYRSPLPLRVGYQNLLPAFVGLFAIPWIVTNLIARIELPPQHIPRDIDAPWPVLLQGVFAGTAGGLFAAFFPVVTGGIGGLLAGQATAQRDSRTFLVAQGAAKVTYYVGGYLLFFVPGLHLTRGGMAWMISTQYTSYMPEQYLLATGAALASGVLAFFFSLWLTRGIIALIARVKYWFLSWVTLALLLILVISLTGITGLGVCAVAAGIGTIPVMWGARRMNAMGILLLPIALNMAGAGDGVARLLGLLH